MTHTQKPAQPHTTATSPLTPLACDALRKQWRLQVLIWWAAGVPPSPPPSFRRSPYHPALVCVDVSLVQYGHYHSLLPSHTHCLVAASRLPPRSSMSLVVCREQLEALGVDPMGTKGRQQQHCWLAATPPMPGTKRIVPPATLITPFFTSRRPSCCLQGPT